ncbi:hypothetical protein ICE98_01389 [Lactococcus lactis]|nr:hypothetical protein [Lactococcus lactis]
MPKANKESLLSLFKKDKKSMNNTVKQMNESAGISNSPLEGQKLNLRTQLSEKYGFVSIKIDRLTIMGNIELGGNQVFKIFASFGM